VALAEKLAIPVFIEIDDLVSISNRVRQERMRPMTLDPGKAVDGQSIASREYTQLS